MTLHILSSHVSYDFLLRVWENIHHVIVVPLYIFQLKEVAPHTAANPANEAFWKKDIKVCLLIG